MGWPKLVFTENKELKSVLRWRDFDDDSHVVPEPDVIQHQPSGNCPCNPYLDQDTETQKALGLSPGSLWVHRDLSNEDERQ